MSLLEPAFLARLERLRVVSKRATPSSAAGERRSTLKGASVEFADHREYALGDDPRLLDWNAYARLERLFVKLFLHEADLAVHLLLDASASMGEGSPEKWTLARRLAGGLGYVTLANLDRAGLAALGGRQAMAAPSDRRTDGFAVAPLPTERGKGRILRLLKWLEDLEPAGRPDAVATLERYAQLQKRPGLCVLISDLLDPAFPEALGALLHRRHEVWCLQVLSPADRGEGLSGDLELVDSETGARREITAAPDVLAAYRRTFAAFQQGFERWCLKRGVGYQLVDSAESFEAVLLSVLRRRRLVR